MSVCSVHPAPASLPARASTDTTTRSPSSATAWSRKSTSRVRRGPEHDPRGARPRPRPGPPRSSAAHRRPAPAPRPRRRCAGRARGSPGRRCARRRGRRRAAPRAPSLTHRRAASSGSASYTVLCVELARGSGGPPCPRGCRWPGAGSCGHATTGPGAAHSPTKARSIRRPCREDFSGWNWTPNTLLARDDRGEPLAVLGAADDVGRDRAGAPRTSARGRRGSRWLGSPAVRGEARSKRTSFQPMCGMRRPPVSSRRDLARRSARDRRRRPISSEVSNSSCMPRQMPSSGVPCRGELTDQLGQAERVAGCASPAGTRRRRAAPGRRRHAAHRGRRVIARSRPTCSSAFSTERRLPIP